MPKRDILLLFVFLFAFETSIAAVQEASEKALKKNMTACIEALVKVRSLNAHTSQEDHNSNYFGASDEKSFRYFWNRSPINKTILGVFANKIDALRHQSDLNMYESQLIHAIFAFMSQMRSSIKSNKISFDILPEYLRRTIGLLDRLSPTEMFIHTRIIEEATRRLESDHEINFEYHEDEFERLLQDLPNVLQSKEQTKHSLSQKETSQTIAEMSQDTYLEGNQETIINDGIYTDFYIKGFNYVNNQLRLAQSLKKRYADYYVTHIPEFADLIEPRINFVRKTFEYQRFSNRSVILTQLEVLEVEAQQKKDDEEFSYYDWFYFNFRLSILLTSRRHRNAGRLINLNNTGELIESNRILEVLYLISIFYGEEPKHEDIEKLFALISEFPERIMIPTIQDLGIMATNKLYQANNLALNQPEVVFIPLNQGPVNENGVFTYPDNMFIQSALRISRNRDNGLRLFNFYLYRKFRGLARLEREMVEYIYFQLTHEEFSFSEFIIYKNSLTRDANRHNANSYTHLLDFVPDGLSQDYEGVKEFVDRGEETFVGLISEMSEELAVIRISFLPNLSERQTIRLYRLMADHFIE